MNPRKARSTCNPVETTTPSTSIVQVRRPSVPTTRAITALAFVIGIVEIVLVVVDVDGRRLGDKLAVTQVVESET